MQTFTLNAGTALYRVYDGKWGYDEHNPGMGDTRFAPIDDPVTTYLPEFQGGQSSITVRDLMTHFSGLRPDVDLEPAWSGYETGIRRALVDKPAGPPETKFVYSDINFILLGEIVKRLSGMPENEYIQKILFDPLGMKDTGYLPRADRRPRIAPTEMQKDGTILRAYLRKQVYPRG